MGFLSILGNLFSGGLFGSITGIISHYLTAKNKIELTKMKYQHDIDMITAKSKYLNAQVAAGVKIQTVKTEGDIALADEKLKDIVYKQAGKRLFDKSYMPYLPTFLKVVVAFMFANVDVLRALIRPILTIIFSAAFIFLFIKSYLYSPSSYILSATLLVDFIVYIIAAIVSFYYMARDFDKHTDKILSQPYNQSGWYEDKAAEAKLENADK